MSGESPHRPAEVLDADGRQIFRPQCGGRSTFPQRQEPLRMVDDGSVGRIFGQAQRVGENPTGSLSAESAIKNPARRLFLYIALGAYEAIAITHAPLIEGDRRKHSITVEPMSEPLS